MPHEEKCTAQRDEYMISIKTTGSFKNTTKFLHNCFNISYKTVLVKYGKKGVKALSDATPVDSGVTAESWKYDIEETQNGYSITWSNTNLNDGVNIAILIQYGHGTRNGGYVVGRDYINPALQPIFDEMAKAVWKELDHK